MTATELFNIIDQTKEFRALSNYRTIRKRHRDGKLTGPGYESVFKKLGYIKIKEAEYGKVNENRT